MKPVLVLAFILAMGAAANAQVKKTVQDGAEGTVLHTWVHFDFGKYNLKKDEKEILDRMLAMMPQVMQSDVYVFGHTDWVGSEAYNMKLGRNRATAVKDYLESLGMHATVVTESFGKDKPMADNKTDEGRRLNRRVEVQFCYAGRLFPGKIKKPESEVQAEKDPGPADSSLVFAQGTRLNITADAVKPYSLREVQFKVKEIYNPDDMLANKATTQDKDGNDLISGGMVIISATVDGKEIQPSAPYTVRLPVDEYNIDKEMQLFVSVKRRGHLVWKLTKVPVNVVKEGDKSYYEFTVNWFGGFNCDKYRKQAATAQSKTAITVKVRGYDIVEACVVSRTAKALVYSHKITGRQANFKYNSSVAEDWRVKISARKNGQYYFVSIPVSSLRWSWLYKKYIVNKNMFSPVAKKRLDELFASR